MIFYVFIVNKFSTHLIESFLVACNGDKEDVEIETKIWNFVTILEFSKCYHSIHFVCKLNPFTRHLAFFAPHHLKVSLGSITLGVNKFALLWGEAQLCLPYVCLCDL